ncbi:MAG: hypothetical protein AAGK32_20670, partial [Actinomycetota bacterium]
PDGGPARAGADPEPSNGWFELRLGVLTKHSLAVFFIAGFVWWLFRNLQAGSQTVVSLLHLPGVVGYTFADLGHRSEEAVATWLRAPSARPDDGLTSAIGIFGWHAMVDLAMIAAATMALAALLSRLNNLLGDQRVGRLTFNAVAGVGLLALIEVMELLVQAVFLNGEWVAQCERAPAEAVGCIGAAPPTWMWNGFGRSLWGGVATAIGIVRPVSILLFVVLPVVFGLGALLRRPATDDGQAEQGSPTPIRLTLVRPVRAQLVAVVVFAVTAVVPLQAPDVFLRLGDGWTAYLSALAASCVFGAVLYASTVAGFDRRRRALKQGARGPLRRSTLFTIG